MNKVSVPFQKLIFAISEVSCDLAHPKSIRALCDSAELYSPGGYFNEEENHETLESFHGPDFDGQEVGGCDLIGVPYEEFFPCCLLHASWSGFDSVPFENLRDATG